MDVIKRLGRFGLAAWIMWCASGVSLAQTESREGMIEGAPKPPTESTGELVEPQPAVFGSIPSVVPQYTFRKTPPTWDIYTEWTFRPGNDRVLGDGQVVVPLWQDGESMLFADIRGQTDDQENYEGNWGLGYRALIDDTFIVGAYGFYDLRRTENRNTFQQTTVGVELLSVEWEARANGYIPGDDAASLGRTGTARLVGNSILVFENQEHALYGFDGEIGALLWDAGEGQVELRGFAGGYHFDHELKSVRNVSGVRTRLELRLYDLELLGEGSRLLAGVEYQYDAVRDDQVFAMLQVRIPLGPIVGSKQGRSLSRIERRMQDRIVRDIDVVSMEGQSAGELARDSKTGRLLTNLTVVDGSTANAAATFNSAPAGGTIFVNGAHGPITPKGSLVTKNGQHVYGGGLTAVGVETGIKATIGSRPEIHQKDTSTDVVVLAENTYVRAISTVGGRHGFATGDGGSDSLINSTVLNNRASYADRDGFRFGNVDVDSLIEANTASNNGSHGFHFCGINEGQVVRNNSQYNALDGFYFAGVNYGSLTGNTATANESNGFLFLGLNNGELTGNIAAGNFASGFVVGGANGGAFSGNVASENSNEGFAFLGVNGGLFSGNTAEDNSGNGLLIIGGNTSEISGNLFQRNGGAGMSVVGLNSGNIIDNSALTNGSHGFAVGGIDSGDWTGNLAQGNLGDGYRLSGAVLGTLDQNSAVENVGSGFRINGLLSGTVSNNNATGNGRDALGNILSASSNGFTIVSTIGTITSNTAEFNANNGFAGSNDAKILKIKGAFTDNVSNSNGDRGYRLNSLSGTTSGNSGADNVNGGNTP